MLFIIVATVGCFILPISPRHLLGWFYQWWIQTFDQGPHHEADPDIWLGQGNLICFPVSHVYFFVGGELKSRAKLDMGDFLPLDRPLGFMMLVTLADPDIQQWSHTSCGAWWFSGKFDALHPEGRRFESSHSRRHVEILDKSFTHSCL